MSDNSEPVLSTLNYQSIPVSQRLQGKRHPSEHVCQLQATAALGKGLRPLGGDLEGMCSVSQVIRQGFLRGAKGFQTCEVAQTCQVHEQLLLYSVVT